MASSEAIELLAEMLRAGVDPGAGLRPILEHRVPGLLVHETPDGLGPKVAEWLERFQVDSEAWMISRRARAAGVPYSVAREMWSSPEDVAAEFAHDWKRSVDELERCPDCGVHPDDYLDPETRRLLDEGRWMIEWGSCYLCETLEKARGDKDASEPGVWIRVVPRSPGEPFEKTLRSL